MTNYRQYNWSIVKAELDSKPSTCKLAVESIAVEKEKSNLLPPSRVTTGQWGVGGCWKSRRRGKAVFCSPACQLCRQLGAFATTSACWRDSDWPAGENCDWNPKWLSFTCLLLMGGQENWPSAAFAFSPECERRVRRRGFGARRWAGVGRGISGAASSMSAKTVSLARICHHTSTGGEMDRRGRNTVSYPSK